MLTIDILTLFPEMFTGVFDYSIIKRAIDKEKLKINLINLRNFSTDNYKSVDDHPYGGGAGMVLRVDIIDRAIREIQNSNNKLQINNKSKKSKVILLDAGGEKYSQKKAVQLSKEKHLIIICGHYEGVDHRVHEHLADEIISVGDYVLSGGEIPAMLIVDSIARLLPDVLGNEESLSEESHNEEGITEYPQYTKPEEYKGWKVPEVLLSGNHKLMEEWKKKKQS